MMTDSLMAARSTPQRNKLILPTMSIVLTLAVLVILFKLSGHSNLANGTTEQTAAGLQYRNAGSGITLTIPASWASRPRWGEAVHSLEKMVAL